MVQDFEARLQHRGGTVFQRLLCVCALPTTSVRLCTLICTADRYSGGRGEKKWSEPTMVASSMMTSRQLTKSMPSRLKPQFGYSIEFQAPIRMRDGVQLANARKRVQKYVDVAYPRPPSTKNRSATRTYVGQWVVGEWMSG